MKMSTYVNFAGKFAECRPFRRLVVITRLHLVIRIAVIAGHLRVRRTEIERDHLLEVGVSGAHDTSGFRPDVVSGAESDSRGFHLGPEVLEEPECPVPA